MSMGPKTIEQWRKRLMHARRVWEEHGLIGTSQTSTMRQLLDFYDGDQWRGGVWRGLDELSTVNKVYSTVNSSVAELSARNPKVQLVPRSERAAEGVIAAEAIVNYDIEQQKFMRQWNKALKDHHFAPFGAVRHGFTPREEFTDTEGKRLEFYRPAQPDRPWMRRIPVWDVLLPPLAERFHNDGGMTWCAFRDMKPTSWFRRNPNMTQRDDLKPNISGVHRETRSRRLLDDENEDFHDLVEFYWVYESEERTWFAMTIDDGVKKLLRQQEDFPLPWAWLPIDIFSVHEKMDSPFAKPLMEEIIPIQVSLNRLRTIMDTIARNTRRILGTSGQIDPDELDKLIEGEIVEVIKTGGNPSEVLQEIRSGGFPSELLQYEGLLNEDIREIKGQSKMDRGQRINVETAAEANFVQRGSSLGSSEEQSSFEEFLGESMKNYMAGRRVTMSEEELVPLLGGDAVTGQEFIKVTREDVNQNFDFKIVAGSTLPEDRDREVQKTLGDLEVAKTFEDLSNIPSILKEYWLERRKSPSRMMVEPQQQQASDDLSTRRGQTQEKRESLNPAAFVPRGS